MNCTCKKRKKKKKEELGTFYEEKQSIDLSKEDEYELHHESADHIGDIYEERLKNTTFADREYYYFKDQKLLEAKAEKYRRMSADEGNVMSEYAGKYEYRSARKRKNYSNDSSSKLAGKFFPKGLKINMYEASAI